MAVEYSTINENNVEMMYHNIWQFKEAGIRCGKAYPITISGVPKVLFLPQIVNTAFAIEIEMKFISLLINKRYICNKHDLLILFEVLPKRVLSLFEQNETSYRNIVENIKTFFLMLDMIFRTANPCTRTL